MNKFFPKCCENLVLNLISLTKGTVLFHLDVQRSLGIQWDLALNYLLVSFYLLCRVNLEMLRVAILSSLVALDGIPPSPTNFEHKIYEYMYLHFSERQV